MIKSRQKSLPVYQFHLLQKYSGDIQHAVFTRDGGVSEGAFESLNVRFGIGDKVGAVAENRLRIVDSFKKTPKDKLTLVSADQTHGKNVLVITDKLSVNEVGDIDGFVTNVPGAVLMIQVADCQGILMCAPSKGVIAAVHAGWRGLVQDISGEVISIMQERFGVDPSEILVGISPSLGPCCSFFSDPETELPSDFVSFTDEQNRVDLWAYSGAQLQSHGVSENHIELARICTQCENGRVKKNRSHFYSFRGDKGITGRFGVVIAMPFS